MKTLEGELVTNVQFANDEGDPGMGLELGKFRFFLNLQMVKNLLIYSILRHYTRSI